MYTKQACSNLDRISKQTVLAMLQTPKTVGFYVGERVQYTETNGQTQNLMVVSVKRDTVVLSNKNGIIEVDKAKVTKEGRASFFDKLSDNQWSIVSFNPKTRVVCIAIHANSGTRNITVTLPVIST